MILDPQFVQYEPSYAVLIATAYVVVCVDAEQRKRTILVRMEREACLVGVERHRLDDGSDGWRHFHFLSLSLSCGRILPSSPSGVNPSWWGPHGCSRYRKGRNPGTACIRERRSRNSDGTHGTPDHHACRPDGRGCRWAEGNESHC